MQIDFHTHSTASDGSLTPGDLIKHAAQAGIDVMALTDHDGTDGLAEARVVAELYQVRLINGIELSVSWNNRTIHIVGLNIDPDYKPLQAGIDKLQQFRAWRAREMANKLAKVGIEGAYEGALKFSGGKMLGRTHFAYFLVEAGYGKNVRSIFKHYLVNNRPGHVSGDWATLEEAVSWITGAGGVAVIAHPARYKLTRSKLRHLIKDFVSVGGQAIEVLSGSHDSNQVRAMANHARDFELYASAGSDFHNPEFCWIKLGKLPALPSGCKPVWELFL